VRSGGVSDQWFMGSVHEVEAGEMTPEIEWDYGSDLFYPACNRDCEHASWLFHYFGNQCIGLWWETLRDMMLHGY